MDLVDAAFLHRRPGFRPRRERALQLRLLGGENLLHLFAREADGVVRCGRHHRGVVSKEVTPSAQRLHFTTASGKSRIALGAARLTGGTSSRSINSTFYIRFMRLSTLPMQENPITSHAAEFAHYREYVTRLDALAEDARASKQWDAAATAALNGQATTELRKLVSLDARRAYGAFFTGSALADRLLSLASRPSNSNAVFYDPTIGSGDLLLAAARRLPTQSTFEKTLRAWGQVLAGTDLHAEFTDAAKSRLVLLARQRLEYFGALPKSWRQFFPQIQCADGLYQNAQVRRATHCLLNPPFGFAESPNGCKWAGGRVSEAAIFVIAILEQMTAGAEMLAILPEVLRAGSFYEHWRERASTLARVHAVTPHGIFDESADVDVFTLRLTRREAESNPRVHRWPCARKRARMQTVGDFFDVHVGRVVPHRDEESGPLCPYIHPRRVPIWGEMRVFPETRRFAGLTYQPPFVVIRRTSRPGHPYRAAATLVLGKEPVAVENHFIVCEPKDGTAKTGRELLRQLKTEAVNDFLNRRIRCRHLTVGSVAAIPLQPPASPQTDDE